MKKLIYTLMLLSITVIVSCNDNSNSSNSDMSGHSGGSNKITTDEKYGEHSDADTTAKADSDTTGTTKDKAAER